METSTNNLLKDHPVFSEYCDHNTHDISTLTCGSGLKADWIGDCGHQWTAVIKSRTDTQGRGCPYCSGNRVLPGFNDLLSQNPDLSKEWSPRNEKTPDEVLRTSGVNYLWNCSKGHEWSTTPKARLAGNGCPYCSGRRAIPGETDLFTLRPDLYKYWSEKNTVDKSSLTKSTRTKVIWNCDVGHEWESTVIAVVRSKIPCPYCSGKRVLPGFNDIKTTHPHLVDTFVDPSLSEKVSKGSDKRLNWVCANGHVTSSTVSNKVRGRRCYKCRTKTSKEELELKKYIESLGVVVEGSDKSILGGKELDIYVPDKKIAFEFNGVFFHSEKFVDNNYHYDKWKKCSDSGIQLITIWQDSWRNRRKIVEKMIAHKLGLSAETKLYARKCEVRLINHEDACNFLEDNHIQGSSSGAIRVGLFYGSDLVSVTVFKVTAHTLRLERYATSCTVVGGFTKIIKFVDKNYEFDKMITFASLDISDGSLYENTGWTKEKILPPDYFYYFKGSRIHKFNFRKSRFKSDSDLIYEDGLTERELAHLNNLYRIYDCGKIRFTRERYQ